MPFQWTRERKVELLLAVAKELDPFWDQIYVALGPRFMHMNRLGISSQYHHLTEAAARLIPLDEDAGASSSVLPLTSTSELSSSAPGAPSASTSHTSATTAPSAIPPSGINDPSISKKRKGHKTKDPSSKRNKTNDSAAITEIKGGFVDDRIVAASANEDRTRNEKDQRTRSGKAMEGGEAEKTVKEEEPAEDADMKE